MYIQLYQRSCQLSVVRPHTEEQATQNLGWSWPLGPEASWSPQDSYLCPRDKLLLIRGAVFGELYFSWWSLLSAAPMGSAMISAHVSLRFLSLRSHLSSQRGSKRPWEQMSLGSHTGVNQFPNSRLSSHCTCSFHLSRDFLYVSLLGVPHFLCAPSSPQWLTVSSSTGPQPTTISPGQVWITTPLWQSLPQGLTVPIFTELNRPHSLNVKL